MSEFELRNDSGRRWSLAVLEGAAQTALFAVFLYTIVGKIWNDGWMPFCMHMTNWSWTLQTLFYGATLAAPFVQQGLIADDSALGLFTQAIIVLFFFPLNGIVFVVVIVISVIIADDSEFVTALLNDWPPGLVLIGNDVFHFWPLIFVILFYIIYQQLIFYALNRVLNRFGIIASGWRLTLFILFEAYFLSGAAFTIYSLIFNPHVVYKTTIPTVDGIVVTAVTLTIFNLIFILVVLGLLRVGYPVAYTRTYLLTNFADPNIIALLDRPAFKQR